MTQQPDHEIESLEADPSQPPRPEEEVADAARDPDGEAGDPDGEEPGTGAVSRPE
jgi:hypothetical protein